MVVSEPTTVSRFTMRVICKNPGSSYFVTCFFYPIHEENSLHLGRIGAANIYASALLDVTEVHCIRAGAALVRNSPLRTGNSMIPLRSSTVSRFTMRVICKNPGSSYFGRIGAANIYASALLDVTEVHCIRAGAALVRNHSVTLHHEGDM
jgi:hypothetical protein